MFRIRLNIIILDPFTRGSKLVAVAIGPGMYTSDLHRLGFHSGLW